jgi:hypothetical protein
MTFFLLVMLERNTRESTCLEKSGFNLGRALEMRGSLVRIESCVYQDRLPGRDQTRQSVIAYPGCDTSSQASR